MDTFTQFTMSLVNENGNLYQFQSRLYIYICNMTCARACVRVRVYICEYVLHRFAVFTDAIHGSILKDRSV